MKVLFVFLHGIGDCIMFTPAIRMYKERYPDRSLGIMCLPLTEQFWLAHPRIDEVFVSKKKDPLPHGRLPSYIIQRMKLQKLINRIRRDHHYDKVEYIVPHSIHILGMSIPVPGLVRRMLTMRFESHEIIRLCNKLGVGSGRKWPADFKQEIFIPRKYDAQARQILRNIKCQKPICILHAQASSRNKSLTFREKNALIDILRRKYTVCLMQERAYRLDVKGLFTTEVITSAAIIKKAKLFVGIDSGPAHIAEVLGIPRIIITKVFRSRLLYMADNRSLLLDKFDRSKIERYVNHAR